MRQSEDQLRPTYSVIIPAFNSGSGLSKLIDRLRKVFEISLEASAEILVINDGSTDSETLETLDTIDALPEVQVVHLTRNFGKSGAVICGLNLAKGYWIVTIDDDLQQNPEDIVALVQNDAHDVVIANYGRKRHTPVQRITSLIKSYFDMRILGYQRKLSPLKLISRDVVNGMLAISTNRPFIPALISQISTDIHFVDLVHQPSTQARSRYTFKRRLKQFLDLLIGNSPFLMHTIAIVGLLLACLSFGLAAIILGRKLLGFEVASGWSSIMVVMLFTGGLNLVAFGIVGEYLIRLMDNVSTKPAFAVRHRRKTAQPSDKIAKPKAEKIVERAKT